MTSFFVFAALGFCCLLLVLLARNLILCMFASIFLVLFVITSGNLLFEFAYAKGHGELRDIQVSDKLTYSRIPISQSGQLMYLWSNESDNMRARMYDVPCAKIRGGCDAIPPDGAMFKFIRVQSENEILVIQITEQV